jgi:subtilisin family serine protease
MRSKALLAGGLLAAVVAAGIPAGAAAAAPSAAGPLAKPLTPATAGALAPGQPFRTITLVTGDRLSVATDGSNRVAVQRTPGREGVQFISRVVDGHLQVTPVDALPLINAGRLDRRLFDVTTLLKFGYDDRRGNLPLIVSYTGGGSARSALRADATSAGASVTRELLAVHGYAVKQDRKQAAAFWKNLTVPARLGAKALRGEVSKVWLDGIRQPSLDVSVPLIGAPQAWAAGYTGDSVPVAVVDTGIDDTHPDLAGKVVAAQNFTDDGDLLDHVGHGTHVASTITGSGAASGGKYKGVAPGAKLYSAKVCELFGCADSWMIAGMQWAAGDQHAKVVNMSIGGGDTPDVDPLEEAVNTLTEQYGTLFVIAAGNDGADGTVESPGTADAALSVGAVTKTEQLAGFSSRGPRIGDSAIKPEITAPGVDITAARGKDGVIGTPTGPDNRYLILSGTSMATPHVAGSAAILAQQHPDWKPAQLKAALMAAAKPNPAIGVYAQGAGRVDIARAVKQSVTATPASVSYGLQVWPHTDDQAITKTVTYHNAGTSALTFNLALHTTGPDNKPTPAGMFTVSPSTVTVPAGGDASVSVTANTSVAGPDGYSGGELTATAGDVVVQTPVAVDKEVESYDITLNFLDRAGKATDQYDSLVFGLDNRFVKGAYDPSGTAKLRVPKGRYNLSTFVYGTDPNHPELTELVQPVVNVDRAQTVTFDARAGKPISVTVPNPAAQLVFGGVDFSVDTASGSSFGSGLLTFTFDGIYTAQVGPAAKVPGFVSTVSGQWGQVQPDRTVKNSPYQYLLAWPQKGSFITGFQRNVDQRDLATVHRDIATEATGALVETVAYYSLPGASGGGWGVAFPYDLPGAHVEYLNSDNGVQWSSELDQSLPSTDPENPFPTLISIAATPAKSYRPGGTYRETSNQGVFGPSFPARQVPEQWATRTGDSMIFAPPMFSDKTGGTGYSLTDTATTTVYKDGVKLDEQAQLGTQLNLPAAAGQYKVTMAATRSAPFNLSTGNSATWTFRSGHVAGTQPLALPVSAIRFTPKLDLQNKAPADCTFAIPVQVQHQPGAATRGTRTLDVQVSYDDGKTWTKAIVLRLGDGGVALVRHPSGSGFVSLKASATDGAGDTVEQTIIHAYRF